MEQWDIFWILQPLRMFHALALQSRTNAGPFVKVLKKIVCCLFVRNACTLWASTISVSQQAMAYSITWATFEYKDRRATLCSIYHLYHEREYSRWSNIRKCTLLVQYIDIRTVRLSRHRLHLLRLIEKWIPRAPSPSGYFMSPRTTAPSKGVIYNIWEGQHLRDRKNSAEGTKLKVCSTVWSCSLYRM